MAEEICWCCNYQMTKKVIPYTNCIIYWCANCEPNFDDAKFAAEYDWDAMNRRV